MTEPTTASLCLVLTPSCDSRDPHQAGKKPSDRGLIHPSLYLLLADHLLQRGLIDQQTQAEFEERAECRLKQLHEEGAAIRGNGQRDGSLSRAPMERLDESGR
jgi:hypothetical protein